MSFNSIIYFSLILRSDVGRFHKWPQWLCRQEKFRKTYVGTQKFTSNWFSSKFSFSMSHSHTLYYISVLKSQKHFILALKFFMTSGLRLVERKLHFDSFTYFVHQSVQSSSQSLTPILPSCQLRGYQNYGSLVNI